MLDLTDELLAQRLGALGRGLVAQYQRATARLAGRLSAAEIGRWRALALDAQAAARGPYAGLAAYLDTAPTALETAGTERFFQWAVLGPELLAISDAVTVAFCEASPAMLALLRNQQVGRWVRQGQRLLRGNARAEQLTVAFFRASPNLYQTLSVEDVDHFITFLARVGEKSFALAADCLRSGYRPFAGIDQRYRRAAADTGSEGARAQLQDLIERTPAFLATIAAEAREIFLGLGERLARVSQEDALAFLNDVARSLSKVEPSRHRLLLEAAARIATLSTTAAAQYLRVAPQLLERLDENSLRAWEDEGRALLAENDEAGVAYFRLQSIQAQERLAAYSRGVDLLAVREVLRLYAKALAGRPVHIAPTTELAERGIGWSSVDLPTTEGSQIYVPPYYERFPTKAENFAAYKVLVTHQAGHLEFGTFGFRFARPARYFAMDPRRQQPSTTAEAISDYQQFFDLFPDRRLGRDLFTIVEDARIDRRIYQQYRGVRSALRMMQAAALAERPTITALPLREALVETLLQLSLEAPGQLRVPRRAGEPLRRAAALLNRASRPEATVEDAAEATLRIYDLLASVPNVHWSATEDTETVTFEELRADPSGTQADDTPTDTLTADPAPSAERPTGESSTAERPERPYHDVPGVGYRGELKPELVQTLQRLTQTEATDAEHAGPPITPEQLQALLSASAEIEWSPDNEGISEAMEIQMLFANLMRERQALQEALEEARQRKLAGETRTVHSEVQSFVYDEWDFRARDYRPEWCRVRQQTLAEGSLDFYTRTLQTYAGMVSAVRKQFEMLRPERLRRRKRLLHGDEIDLDLAIEHMVDRRARQAPNDKLYWKQNKDERDVVVALLLDMSASTDEQIRPLERYSADGQRIFERGKRIIDIEKESIVLLIKALESIGDRFGIYGFSGHGRSNIQFYVIKEITEPLNDMVKRRLDRIAPVQGTRMGGAIRHTISKLDAVEAKTKILMVLSDGRPQDYDYGRDPGDLEYSIHSFMEWMVMPSLDEMLDRRDKEYAIHDTKQALNEAKQRAIIPFCLSVDRAGHDYLKAMCGDIGYEVVSDIESLPKRLPALYRKLTT